VPTPAPDILAHALLFRPPGDGPFALAVIAHATTQNVLRRAQMPQPHYRAAGGVAGGARLCRAGAGTPRPWRDRAANISRIRGGCDEADYLRSGRATADAMASAASFMRKQSFIKPRGMVIVGHSAGGLGALAMAKEDPKDVAAIIVFAAGRGGRATIFPTRFARRIRWSREAREFSNGARVPVTWLVAANDKLFFAGVFQATRGCVPGWWRQGRLFTVLPASGGEGHWLAETESGVRRRHQASIARSGVGGQGRSGKQ